MNATPCLVGMVNSRRRQNEDPVGGRRKRPFATRVLCRFFEHGDKLIVVMLPATARVEATRASLLGGAAPGFR